jgi:zinc transport system substrate-binding protein
LHSADLVFWVSEDLAPWLARALASLPEERVTIAMMDRDATRRLETRETALFTGADADTDAHDEHGHAAKASHHDDHDHDHAETAAHGHDDPHDEAATHAHDHAAEDKHDDHAHGHGHDHAHGAFDPHGWLDPENGAVWLAAIASDLAAADPENAELYRANADAGKARIEAAAERASELIQPVSGLRYVVFHDAYQYFENRFDLQPIGAISLSDASDPGPAHLSALRKEISRQGIRCIFAEPQFNSDIVKTVVEGSGAQAAVLDPLGQGIDLGADFYPSLLVDLADSIAGCMETS